MPRVRPSTSKDTTFSTASYITFGPNTTAPHAAKVTAVQNQSGPGPSGPKMRARSAEPEIRAHAGRKIPRKPIAIRAQMIPIQKRPKPVWGASPVAMAQRPISRFTQTWRKTPSAAAHSMTAPNLAVIHGQTTISPAPIERPTSTAPGPLICQKERVRFGRSAVPIAGIRAGMNCPGGDHTRTLLPDTLPDSRLPRSGASPRDNPQS